jgi:hypothetical protein
MRRWSVAAIITFCALALFALFFVFLSSDIMVRIWSWRSRFEHPLDVAFLLYMESMRIIVTVAGVAVAVTAARRGARDTAPLALGVLFLTIAYTKLIAFDGFPGERQEQLALWLRARGVSQHALAVFFAHPEWSLWLALGGLLLFAARYPQSVTADDVTRSGADDRAGAMRSVALAGTDIGALARRATSHALSRGWLNGRVVWSTALIAAAVHTTAARIADGALIVHVIAITVALLPVSVLVALVRADLMIADVAARQTLVWLRRGALAGLALFALAAFVTQLLRELPVGPLLLSVAPALIVFCWLIAALRLPRQYRADAVARRVTSTA